jgi:hypothetical protein
VIALTGEEKPPSLLISPNSMLANALLRSVDLLRPRVRAVRPSRIEFVVGTQINGVPHLGTNLVQTTAFLLAKIARREFSLDTCVRFGALDNAPHEVVLDPETHHAYQQTYFHALGKDRIGELIESYYGAFFDSVAAATDIGWPPHTASCTSGCPVPSAGGRRNAPTAPNYPTWMRTARCSLPCVWTTAATRFTSTPKTVRPIWTWPRCTGI